MGSVFGHEVASCKSDGMPEKRTSGSFPEDNAAAEKNAAGKTLGNRALSVCGRGPPHPPGISPGLPLRWLGRSRPAPAGSGWGRGTLLREEPPRTRSGLSPDRGEPFRLWMAPTAFRGLPFCYGPATPAFFGREPYTAKFPPHSLPVDKKARGGKGGAWVDASHSFSP